MKSSGYEVYKTWLALRNHFTSTSYDYFKYHGKTNSTVDSYDHNKMRFHFERLAKGLNEEEVVDFFVANFLKGKKWIGDFLTHDAKINLAEYQRIHQSLFYVFETDLNNLLNRHKHPKELFQNKSGQYPPIITALLNEEITKETFVILNKYLKFFPQFDNRLGEDDVIWGKIRFELNKYSPFILYDKKKFKSKLKEIFDGRLSDQGQEASSKKVPETT